MGGLGPGIGGLEILVIGLLALIVVGPKDLPLMMRKVGQFLARARAMASEFRSTFDEMARQAELDELRREVEALRNAQAVPLGPEAEEAFRDIDKSLKEPLAPPTAIPAPVSEPEPQALPQPEVNASEAAGKPKAVRKPRAKAAKPSLTKATAPAQAPARSKVARKKAVDL